MKNSIEYTLNVKKPQENEFGIAQLADMNIRHNELSLWGLNHIAIYEHNCILDIGCGGGKNISNMLERSNEACVFGVDYSPASVKASLELNKQFVSSGRVQVKEGSAESLPFESTQFDLVTAFETIYFWDISKGFKEVYRVLKAGGKFAITNEAQTRAGMEDMIALIGMEVYDATEIQEALLKAGFKNINTDLHTNGKWLNIVAEK